MINASILPKELINSNRNQIVGDLAFLIIKTKAKIDGFLLKK
jgi:hypothetical protein